MILNAEPSGKGIVLTGTVGAHEAELFAPGLHDERDKNASVVDVYTDHHVTCPKAADWKGRTRQSPPEASR